MQVYVDMDGVIADFDSHHEALFGRRPDKEKKVDVVDWKAIDKHGLYFRTMPPMQDYIELWKAVEPLKPIILTGIPTNKDAPQHKREWAAEHIDPIAGRKVEVITCPSKLKYTYCKPGDLIIDDWAKYRHLWLDAGGIWILHRSAKESIAELKKMGIL